MLRPSFVCGASVATMSLCLAATTAFGQEAVIRGAQQKSVQVVRASTPPVIDGVLDEAVWQTAAMVDDLHEIEPVEYAEPSEYTVVRVLFDDESLYVAARMYDDEPEQITARIMRHGQQVWGDDFFALVIDPFYDRRNGYRFVTNPNGVRQEGLFQNVTDTEWEWQGIWYAAATVDDEGWTAEIRIPLKTISFDPDGDTWGINFRRGIGRRDERIGWVSRNRQTGPSTAGIAVGFEGLRQGMGLDIVPSIAVTERKTFAAGPDDTSVTTTDTEPSLDVFYKITPGLTSALTINTDFSATEVDDRQVNLTRFGLFFPEKRDFFLQDADIFEFGSLDNNGRPFFSRSVGLSAAGQPVDLEVGGKITGRVGRFNIGALTVRQDQSAGRGVDGNEVLFPKDNAVVARVSANILEESAIGLIATEGNPTDSRDNSVQGIDFAFRNTRLPGNRSMAVTAWAQQSDTEGLRGDDRAYGFRVDSPNEEGWQGDLAFTHIEENFNPGLGFVNNEGIEQINYNTMHVWRRSGLLRMIRTGVDFEKSDYIDDGGLQSKRRTWRLFELESFLGDQLEIRHHWRDEVLIEDFEISDGVVLPVGAYSFRDLSIEFETASNRKLSGQFGYREGPFYGGDRVQTEFGVSWRPSRRFFASMSYEINDIDLPQGNFVTRLAQYRAEVAISPRLSWVTLVQYDNVSEIVGVNSRVHWFPEPGREAFVVINHNVQDLDRDNTFHSIEADVSIKYNYTFRF
ncbi:MAG TPA: sugar-binding protein [Gammaproteobacteria bacterium]